MLPNRPSLAVLPFDSLGGSSDNSYFADGMTDDIITDLSKLSGILIIARNSSWTYKGKSAQLGAENGRDHSCRCRCCGKALTRLVRAGDRARPSGEHMWPGVGVLADRPILLGVLRQPNALAHAVSAEVLSKQGRYEEAFVEIGHAMALAPNDPDNYLSKARILNATGRAAEAEESVRWAMRLDPLYSPDYLRTLAISLFHQQHYEEAVGIIEKVLPTTDIADDYTTLIASLGYLGRKSGVPDAIKKFNELSVSAGYNMITVQMFGAWWWYGDLFNYDAAYRIS